MVGDFTKSSADHSHCSSVAPRWSGSAHQVPVCHHHRLPPLYNTESTTMPLQTFKPRTDNPHYRGTWQTVSIYRAAEHKILPLVISHHLEHLLVCTKSLCHCDRPPSHRLAPYREVPGFAAWGPPLQSSATASSPELSDTLQTHSRISLPHTGGSCGSDGRALIQ